MITIIGIGRNKGDMTAAARQAAENAKAVIVRTFKSSAAKALENAESMDDLFDSCSDFDELAEKAARRLLDREKEFGSVAYCTDGDALTDQTAAKLLAVGRDVKVIRGVTGGLDECADCRMTCSASGFLRRRPYIDTAAALEITEIDDKLTAGELKLRLLDFYAPDTLVKFGTPGCSETIALEDLDRQKKYGAETALFISGDDSLSKKRYCFADLLRIMERLTAPDGCPWDKAQTHESICPNMIEEAYEAVDALESGDIDAMKEEIGDVMLQAVFHCDIASRTGEFDLGDALSVLCGKLYFRHTHIFGSDKASDPVQALKFWENAKAAEKSYTDLYDILSRLPKGFPSLLRAEKAVKKAIKADLQEKGEPISEEELASRLFELVVRAASSGADAETALSRAVNEYIESFKR